MRVANINLTHGPTVVVLREVQQEAVHDVADVSGGVVHAEGARRRHGSLGRCCDGTHVHLIV